MRVLYALLAFVAIAQKDKKKTKKKKAPTACFGKEDEDHFGCMKLKDEDVCKANDSCDWGTDRVEKKKVDMENCMTKNKVEVGALCDKPGEVDTCGCGMVCHYIEWAKKKVCTSCMDMGVKADCDNTPGLLSCKWIGGEDDGKCISGKNDCSELGKKDCAAAKGKCMYMKKEKLCLKNYADSCFGVKEDTHGKCYDVATKADCLAVKTMFNKPLCKWGYNPYDREEKNAKCIEDLKDGIAATCDGPSDCECGSTCFEMDWGGFKTKGCTLCKDFGIKEDCDLGADGGMGCKWVGKDSENGVCLKKDMCKELSLEEDKCNANPACKYMNDDDMCVMQKITKATCKAIGKRKKGVKKDEVSIAKDAAMCKSLLECQWTEKGKCVFKKSK